MSDAQLGVLAEHLRFRAGEVPEDSFAFKNLVAAAKAGVDVKTGEVLAPAPATDDQPIDVEFAAIEEAAIADRAAKVAAKDAAPVPPPSPVINQHGLSEEDRQLLVDSAKDAGLDEKALAKATFDLVKVRRFADLTQVQYAAILAHVNDLPSPVNDDEAAEELARQAAKDLGGPA